EETATLLNFQLSMGQALMSEKFNLKQWLLIALLFRLLVMPFTLHGDIFFVNIYPHFLAHGIWDAYGVGLEKNHVGYYPPLAMIFFALVQMVLGFIFPGFEEFLHSITYQSVDPLDSKQLFLALFLMKLPYLAVEFSLITICLRMTSEDKDKRTFMVFWAVNPLVIYGTYMVGHLDLIPTFLVALACYFSLRQGEEHWACLSLAAGGLFKVFPIIFLPVVLCIASRDLKDSIRLLLYGVVPVVFVYGVFYLISGEAVFDVFIALNHDLDASVDFSNLFLRLCQAIVYGLVCWHILFLRQGRLDYFMLAQYFLIVYLAVYWGHLLASTHRYIWFIPFMILYVQSRPRWRKPFYLLMTIIFLAGLRSRKQTLGIFAPLNPEFFLSLPSLKDVTWFVFGPRAYDVAVAVSFKVVTAVMTLALLKKLYFPSRHEA
ncbi:MAG: hypothetical protein ACE5GQ_09675, partial [Nitrospinales bacterium]